MTPYKGETVTDEQKEFNKIMSSQRICVEWGFDEITRIFAFFDFIPEIIPPAIWNVISCRSDLNKL